MLIGVKNYSKSVYQAGYEEKEGKKRQNLFWNSHSYYHANKDNQKL